MANKTHLSLVEGTGGQLTATASAAATGGFRNTGILTEDGGTYYRGPSGSAASQHSDSGGGGAMKLTLPDLRWNVAILNGLATLFFLGFVAMWLWMVDRIDDKFEVADNRNREIARDIGQIRESSARQDAALQIILQRLGNEPQGSPSEGQTQPVR